MSKQTKPKQSNAEGYIGAVLLFITDLMLVAVLVLGFLPKTATDAYKWVRRQETTICNPLDKDPGIQYWCKHTYVYNR